MLPFMAQGAAQSIEDGATLAALLTAMPNDLPAVLRRYEELRKPRATRLQEASAANRTRFHLHDGPEQQKRDQAMGASATVQLPTSAGSTCTMRRRWTEAEERRLLIDLAPAGSRRVENSASYFVDDSSYLRNSETTRNSLRGLDSKLANRILPGSCFF